jgi:hypothetical protein
MASWFAVLALVACTPSDPRVPVGPVASQQLEAAIRDSEGMTAADFARLHPSGLAPAIGYPVAGAAGLDLIQHSPLSLTPAEMDVLVRHGLVVSSRQHFPTFAYGYAAVYMADLPLFISVDSVLDAVHHSYDDILKTVEVNALVPALGEMLTSMRSSLVAGGASALGREARADADLYLAVARSLLSGSLASPVAGPRPRRSDRWCRMPQPAAA